MVPLRFVAESFGIDVQYDATSKMITLTYVSYTTPVVQLPSAPTLISPVTNSTFNNSNITFTWTAVSGVDYYKLQITNNGSVVQSNSSILINSYTLMGVTFVDGTYSWQVASHNSAGWSSWSSSFAFSISNPQQLPAAPVLSSPANTSTLNNSNITFTWMPVTGADSYRLQITKDGSTVNSEKNITTTSYSIPSGTLSDGTYSWQVAAHNSAGWGNWSDVWHFSTATTTISSAAGLTNYLKENYSKLTTVVGTTTFNFTVYHNDTTMCPYDYEIEVLYDFTFFYKISYSNTISDETRQEAVNELKDFMEKLARDVINKMPNTKLYGMYYYFWYDYPDFEIGYNAERHFSWVNYSPAGFSTNSYNDAKITAFTWWSFIDDPLP